MENEQIANLEEEKSCFVMMPFREYKGYPEGHFKYVYEQIFKPSIEAAGFKPYRVDEDIISTSIIDKIFRAVQECDIALCDLSCGNPNVMYELGLRHAYDKPVVLVKDDTSETVFDVGGITTIKYCKTRLFDEVMDAREKITYALKTTYQNKGKCSSIVKYIKIKEAKFGEANINGNEAAEIMFEKILNEIKELKYQKEDSIYDIYNSLVSGRYILNSPSDFNLFSDKLDFIIDCWEKEERKITEDEYNYLENIIL